VPPAVDRARNLQQRVVTALVVAPPALGALWLGAPVLAAFLAVIALLLAWEWDRLCGGRFDASGVALAVGLLAVIAACGEQAWSLALALVAATAMAVFAVRRAIRRPAKLWSAFGAVYIGLPAVALLWLRAGPEAGRTIVFWVVAVTVATDIGGYAAGRPM
jgi:phosphatidate cytidylyltransferase